MKAVNCNIVFQSACCDLSIDGHIFCILRNNIIQLHLIYNRSPPIYTIKLTYGPEIRSLNISKT